MPIFSRLLVLVRWVSICASYLVPRLLNDIRLALRLIRRNPGFAATAIATLALGIGATAAIFSFINAVALRPLPFPRPERLMWLQQADHTPGLPPDSAEPLSYPDYFDWRARSRSFEGMAAYRNASGTLTGSGQPLQVQGYVVSANFFRVLGAQPTLGRNFLLEEEKPGLRAAMLSHDLWQSRFGSAPDIAGRSITLDGHSYVVAGVMPAGFVFPPSDPPPALWLTLAHDAQGAKPLTSQRGADMLEVVARLQPGVSREQASAELSLVARQIAERYVDTNKFYTSATVEPLLDHLIGDYRPALRVLFAAVFCLLLIACANVAGLMLARASRRAPELAVRAALGASRAEIMRQVVSEAVVLSLCGGFLGVLFSSWVLGALLRYVPQDIPRISSVRLDLPVLAFVTAISILSGLLFGAAPAWRTAYFGPATALRDQGRGATTGRGGNRMHAWIVVAETAISLALLAGSGLLIKTFVGVLRVRPGFDPNHVLTAGLTLPDRTYSKAQKTQFYDRLMTRLALLPGVESVAAGFPLPLAEGSIGISFQIEGKPVAPGEEPSEQMAVATPDFFRTLRIPVLKGREFAPTDDKHGQPAIIVNDAFAHKYFPGEDPIGKRIKSDLSDGDGDPPFREVVGVVENVKRKKLTAPPEPMYYLPFAQAVITSPAICVRTVEDPGLITAALRAEVARQDPTVPLYRIHTLAGLVSNAASEPRFHMLLVTSFALLALVLAAVGLYAVLSYTVAQRTSEIGLRMALGAQPGDVLSWVLRRGLLLSAAGAAIGLALAAALTRYMQDLLFGVKPLDPLTLAAVTLALLAVTGAASLLPAWRASRLDPAETLRNQ